MAQAPYEIIAAPPELYVAVLGTAWPDLSDAPIAPWALLGLLGNKNYTDDGVEITHDQEIEPFTPVGLTVPYKIFRTSEDIRIAVSIVDISAATYAKVLNDITVIDTAASGPNAGNLNFDLMRGPQVEQYQMLVRIPESPSGEGFIMQYEFPRVYEGGTPHPQYMKGTPAMLECEFGCVWDSADGVGRLRIQDALPLTS